MTTPTNKDGVTKTERWDKYRAKGQVGWKTTSLFADLETCPQPEVAPFWLNRNKTGDDRPCFRDWFLHLEDMTGNQLALKFLGSQEHWDVMYAKSPWFKTAVDEWKAELFVTLKQRALSRLLKIMESDNEAQASSAAKFIYAQMDHLTGDDHEVRKSKRGRPSKAELDGHLKNMAQNELNTEEDYRRIQEELDKDV